MEVLLRHPALALSGDQHASGLTANTAALLHCTSTILSRNHHTILKYEPDSAKWLVHGYDSGFPQHARKAGVASRNAVGRVAQSATPPIGILSNLSRPLVASTGSRSVILPQTPNLAFKFPSVSDLLFYHATIRN